MLNSKIILIASLSMLFSAVVSCAKDENKTYEHRPGGSGGEETGEVLTAEYVLGYDTPKQTIEGIGVELQSDAFGPNYRNDDPLKGVPYELTVSERRRLSKEVLKGFRYLRLASGLWFRGLTDDEKNIVERYPGQAQDILNLMNDAGMEAISYEYWSVAPYWKSSNHLVSGSIKQFDPDFLDELGDALAKDVQYMLDKGFKIRAWGLQNEAAQPTTNVLNYPHVYYTAENYVSVFKAVVPKIKKVIPEAEIIAETMNGCLGKFGSAIRKDPEALELLDTWVYHKTGSNADLMIEKAELMSKDRCGKPIYTNEYEYFSEQMEAWSDEFRMVNIANNVMNWMTFLDAPTWYWLHVLKPINDSNHKGFGLGVYRPVGYSGMQDEYGGLQEGHWQIQPVNYNGIAGFAHHLPWDSVRYEVKEPEPTRTDQRIMAWISPEGKRGFVLTNRSAATFDFVLDLTAANVEFNGYLYDRDYNNKSLSPIKGGAKCTVRLDPWSIQFWVEK